MTALARHISAHGEIPSDARGASIALGNFDGVHIGHQAVVAGARRANAVLAAAVFEPHPRQFFQQAVKPFRLQSPLQRMRALESLGVETIFEIRFDAALAALTDQAFVDEILVGALGAKQVAVGFDFRFGRDRMGDAAGLQRLCAAHGVAVSVIDAVDDASHDREKVSSSAIRAAIEAGDVAEAADFLTRPFAIEGVVGPGAQRGRTIDFPTANVALSGYVRPLFGVYAVRVDVGDGQWRAGVANCGVKPTVQGAGAEPLLEAHIFDFAQDIYGHRIEVQLIEKLRAERKFESFEALKAQIAADAAAARAILTAAP